MRRSAILAGVRIATYLESDRDSVVEELKKEFVGLGGADPVVEVMDRVDDGRHYRATHCQIYLPEEDLSGINENLKNTTCEIQVCSLLAHVFNEIEHDLQYKPLSGDLSEAERELIDQLGLLTKAGDITIKRLLDETDIRLKKRTGDFSDVYDFVARMREAMKMNGFSANAGQLYDELLTLDLKTPEVISKKVIGKSNKTPHEISNTEYQKFKNYLAANQPDLQLEDGSSDVLLVGILKSSVDKILNNHPMGRGMGRPSRLAQIAKAYRRMLDCERDMKKSEESGMEPR